mmetsp:Transcript_3361/g.8641  ORF Transcript_3361/g.8641 Transcript_3361/m.8641 type:complete len:216 (-) Transcript_3361:355-1002(-)
MNERYTPSHPHPHPSFRKLRNRHLTAEILKLLPKLVRSPKPAREIRLLVEGSVALEVVNDVFEQVRPLSINTKVHAVDRRVVHVKVVELWRVVHEDTQRISWRSIHFFDAFRSLVEHVAEQGNVLIREIAYAFDVRAVAQAEAVEVFRRVVVLENVFVFVVAGAHVRVRRPLRVDVQEHVFVVEEKSFFFLFTCENFVHPRDCPRWYVVDVRQVS